MKKLDESLSFYDEAVNLIDLEDYDGAIKSIKKNIAVSYTHLTLPTKRIV